METSVRAVRQQSLAARVDGKVHAVRVAVDQLRRRGRAGGEKRQSSCEQEQAGAAQVL